MGESSPGQGVRQSNLDRLTSDASRSPHRFVNGSNLEPSFIRQAAGHACGRKSPEGIAWFEHKVDLLGPPWSHASSYASCPSGADDARPPAQVKIPVLVLCLLGLGGVIAAGEGRGLPDPTSVA